MVSANHRPHSLRGDAVVSGFMDFITRLRHHEGFHAAGPCMLMHLIQDSRILHSSLLVHNLVPAATATEVICGASLYSLSNVQEEILLKRHCSRYEALGMLGVLGSHSAVLSCRYTSTGLAFCDVLS